MREWRVLIDNGLPAPAQMARDERLADEPIPTLRLFSWSPPAVSLGLKQPHPGWLEEPPWRAGGLELVERPTGGGIAFHGSDLSVSVIVPRSLGLSVSMLMRAVCHSAMRLCRAYGLEASVLLDAPAHRRITYCLHEVSPYAVLIGTRKLAGFALRRYLRGWLVQGSLLVRPLPEALRCAVPAQVVAQLEARAIALSEAAHASVQVEQVARCWADEWAAWWAEAMCDAALMV